MLKHLPEYRIGDYVDVPERLQITEQLRIELQTEINKRIETRFASGTTSCKRVVVPSIFSDSLECTRYRDSYVHIGHEEAQAVLKGSWDYEVVEAISVLPVKVYVTRCKCNPGG